MTDMTWHRVGRALLGRWPSQVATWGADGISAFVEELQADGLSPEAALVAVRTYRPEPGKDFPPSVAAVSELARRDPSAPTFDEALVLIRRAFRAGRRPLVGDFATEAQMIGAREEMIRTAASDTHPLVASFVDRCGDLSRLQDEIAEMEGGEFAGIRRRDLEARWEQHREAMSGRELAGLAAGRRDGLRQLDPLAALGLRRASELVASTEKGRDHA